MTRLSTALVCLLLLACTKEASETDLSGGQEVGNRPASRWGDQGPDQPDAADLAALEPYVDELLTEHSRVVNLIYADPSVAADRDADLVQDFLALYEPGSSVADQLLDAWEQDGKTGLATVALDETAPAFSSRLDGDLERVTSDEIRILTCETLRYRSLVNGTEVTEVPYLEHWGEATLVRIDGDWRFHRRDINTQMLRCRTDGG